MTTTIDAPVVETVECKRGTVTLTTTAKGWTIVGVHKTHQNRVFKFAVPRCTAHPANFDDTARLCPKRCDAHVHRFKDAPPLSHCRSRGHEITVRALLASICATYNAPMPTTATTHKAILTRVGGSDRIVLTKAELAELDKCKVPTP